MKLKRLPLFTVILMVFFMCVSPVFAQRRQIIKIGSAAPPNTPFQAALEKLAAEFNAATNGRVELIIHHGTAGDDEQIIERIKGNSLQGGVITSFGLNLVTPEMLTLSTPFTIRDDGEFNAVFNTLRPTLEQKIEGKGFIPLALTKAGWIRIFSKRPVLVPADLKAQKLGTNPTEAELTRAFTAMGFNVVPISLNETLTALTGGMVDAIYNSPIYVGGMQVFTVAKYMTGINLCPFMGGLVLSNRAWQSIPDVYKPVLLELSKKMEEEFNYSLPKFEGDAIRSMSNLGLVINTLTSEQQNTWYRETEQGIRSIIGTTFDKTTYDQMMLILNEYRSNR